MKLKPFFISIALLFLLGGFAPCGLAAPLAESIAANLDRVEAFHFISEQAKKLGLRVYIGGEAASGLASYARDHQNPAKPADWNLSSIFRLDESLDIVIDGPEKSAEKLRLLVESEYPLFLEKESAWKFRSFGELSSNPDFLLPNSDSYSTGLIELTVPAQGEQRILDLRAMKSSATPFLADIEKNEITFYPPGNSEGLKRKFVDALRFLAESAQRGATIKKESLEEIRKIVAEFKPGDYSKDAALRARVEQLGKKILTDAQDLESTWNLLEELGLRQRLIAFGVPSRVGSASWLMNREPFRSSEMRSGREGKTARALFKELGLEDMTISHETQDWAIYQAITGNPEGKPNFFISRTGREFEGEMAHFGEGVYARAGKSGRAPQGGGYTIRMELNPDAILGKDFDYSDTRIVLKNRNAVRILREDPKSVSLDEIIRNRALPIEGKQISAERRQLLNRITQPLRAKLKAEINRLLLSRNEKTISELVNLLSLLPSQQYWLGLIDEKNLAPLAELLRVENSHTAILTILYEMNAEKLFRELSDSAKTALAESLAKVVNGEVAKELPDGKFLLKISKAARGAGQTKPFAEALLAFARANVNAEDHKLNGRAFSLWFELPESKNYPEILADFVRLPMGERRAVEVIDSIFGNPDLLNLVPAANQMEVLRASASYLNVPEVYFRGEDKQWRKQVLAKRANTEAFQTFSRMAAPPPVPAVRRESPKSPAGTAPVDCPGFFGKLLGRIGIQ